MDKHDYFFTPDQIDEQIESFTASGQTGSDDTSEAHLFAEMDTVVRMLRAEQESSLQRTWLRLQERKRRMASPFSLQKRGQEMQQEMQKEETFSFFPQSRRAKRSLSPGVPRLLSAVAAVAAVLFIVLAWTVLIPAFRAHPGGTTGASPTRLVMPSATTQLPGIRRVCSFNDNNPGAAGFAVSYSVDWSVAEHIAFTHRNSEVISGNNCQRDSQYHDKLSIPEGAVWSPDGKTLLAYSIRTTNGLTTISLQIVNENGQIQKTVDLQTGGPVGAVSPGGGWLSGSINLSANKSDHWGPAWSPDGSKFSAIFFHDGAFHLMTWQTQDEKQVLDAPLDLVLTDAAISAVSWSPAGNLVAIATGDPQVGVLLVNARTGSLVKHIATQSVWITNLAWSPDGQELATSNRDYQVQTWNVDSGKRIRSFVGARGAGDIDSDLQIAWSPDGTKIVGGDSKPVIWDVVSGKVIATIQSANPLVVAMAWSHDGQRLVTISTTAESTTQTRATLEIWHI